MSLRLDCGGLALLNIEGGGYRLHILGDTKYYDVFVDLYACLVLLDVLLFFLINLCTYDINIIHYDIHS